MIKITKDSAYINKGMKNTVSVQKVLHFISTIITPDFIDTKEMHDFWEIVYLELGEAEIEADNDHFRLLSGEVFFHKPGQAHSIKAHNAPITVFFISFHSTSKLMAVFDGLKLSLSAEQKRLIYKIYDEARNIFEGGDRAGDPDAFVSKSLIANPPLGSQQLYKLHIEEFILSTARSLEKDIVTYSSKEELEKLILEQIISYLYDSVYSTFSVDNLCKSLNYSRTYLSALFKKYRKTSLVYYYNSLKIKEAKKLLTDKGYSVSEVSTLLSFNNPYYFSKVFKRYENITPKEYKLLNAKTKKSE